MARLMSVHAHPDDEASKGAPTVAKAVAEGHEASLVCCTGGEEGDIHNPAMERPEVRANLVQIRSEELARSVKAIGFHELVMLGYRDSGMEGEPANDNPECFWQADLDEATGRLVREIRRFRPHVILTYSDDQQGYRHPDHLRVHDISILAYERAGDPEWYPELGEPWQPQKLYYSTWSRARLSGWHAKYAELGLESPYDEKWFERPDQDHRITAKIDVTDHWRARTESLLAHATQIDPEEKFWFGLTDEHAVAAYPYEDFVLGRSEASVEGIESDLFEGIT